MTRNRARHRCGILAPPSPLSPSLRERPTNPNSERCSSGARTNLPGISSFHFSNSELPPRTVNLDVATPGAPRAGTRLARPVVSTNRQSEITNHTVLTGTPERLESLATRTKQRVEHPSNRYRSCDGLALFSACFLAGRIGRADVAAALPLPTPERHQPPLKSIPVLQFTVPAKEQTKVQFNERIGVQP